MSGNTVDLIGDEALTNAFIDGSLEELVDDTLTAIKQYLFHGCTKLKRVDLPNVTSIERSSFLDCTSLQTLILRANQVCSLGSYVFRYSDRNTSGIANGTGYIYVPSALVESYKTDSNWSTYANQIRAIEDYPEVCSNLGKVWKQSVGTTGSMDSVAYGNGMWVAGANGRLYSSADGVNWTRRLSATGAGDFKSAAYGNGMWVAGCSKKGIYYSADGQSWSQSNITSIGVAQIVHGNGLWVAGTSSNGLYYSTDGATWTQSDLTTLIVYGVTYNDGLWVASCNGGARYSTDGKTWTSSNVTGTCYAVRYDNGVWVAGTGGKGMYYSADGKTWTQSNITNKYCYNVVYGNGVWVATCADGLRYSTDGKTWAFSDTTDTAFSEVAYGNGVFVAGADSNRSMTVLRYSTDGQTWASSDSPSTFMEQVAYANGMFVAACTDGLLYSKP